MQGLLLSHLICAGLVGGVGAADVGKLCLEHGNMCSKLTKFCLIFTGLFIGFLHLFFQCRNLCVYILSKHSK